MIGYLKNEIKNDLKDRHIRMDYAFMGVIVGLIFITLLIIMIT